MDLWMQSSGSMHRLMLVALPLLLFFSQKLAGQSDSTRIRLFPGKVVDDSLGFALPSVHIWNESSRTGSISNGSGEFVTHVRDQDTLVFSAIGYYSHVLVVSSLVDQEVIVRLKSKKYEIGEVLVRRFKSYESFKYAVVHHDLPESETAELNAYLKITSIAAALEVDREKTIEEKLETGRFGYITPLGKGIDHEKAFKEKIADLEKKEKVIHAKFNRKMVSELTQLEGDELTEFIALCAFSDDYLYETDLYTIIEAMYAKLSDYQNRRDTIRSD